MGGITRVFLRIGHRGARAYATENTLDSFRKAVGMGANAIEMDVRMAGDGNLIVCHDDNLKRVFGRDIAVGNASLKLLKKETEGLIPTLGEALSDLDGQVDKILIELKEPGYEKKVIAAVVKARLLDRVIVISFHEPVLEEVKKLRGDIETGLIYARHKNPLETALRLGTRCLVPLYRFVHTRDIEKAHRNNLRVYVWTINTSKEAEAYITKGVDGIATDKPDIFTGMA